VSGSIGAAAGSGGAIVPLGFDFGARNGKTVVPKFATDSRQLCANFAFAALARDGFSSFRHSALLFAGA
jgi:hypothetical protein